LAKRTFVKLIVHLEYASPCASGRELLFDPPETLEMGIASFLVSLVQLFERLVSELRVPDRPADLVPLALVSPSRSATIVRSNCSSGRTSEA
jgi:hypothetical protein